MSALVAYAASYRSYEANESVAGPHLMVRLVHIFVQKSVFVEVAMVGVKPAWADVLALGL